VTPLDQARANLARVEQDARDAQTAHEQAEAKFHREPAADTHTAAAVAAQLATNARAALQVAREAVTIAERAELSGKLADAIARAQPSALYAATEPALVRLRELHSEIVSLVGSIEATCLQQHEACREADALAKQLNVAAPVPRRVAPTFLRAIVGIRIARDAYVAGSRWTLGREPWTYVAARPATHRDQDEWRRARALALPADEFLPATPPYDFHHHLVDAPEFYHRPLHGQRPSRHEIG
jgi:hypothetical protein